MFLEGTGVGVQKSDKPNSASFQPLAVFPSGYRKNDLKRSMSSPAAQPLGSICGTASSSRPYFTMSSSVVLAWRRPPGWGGVPQTSANCSPSSDPFHALTETKFHSFSSIGPLFLSSSLTKRRGKGLANHACFESLTATPASPRLGSKHVPWHGSLW